MMVLYIVCKNKEEAEAISKSLLAKKLVACTNYFPISSMYHWQGKLVGDDEVALIAKTNGKNQKNVEKEVLKMHSYSTPCIIRFKVKSNKQYLDWLNKELEK